MTGTADMAGVPGPVGLAAAPVWRPVRVSGAGGAGGEVLVGVVDGRRSGEGPTFVVALGFQAYVEPFEMQRFRVLAALLGVRFVVVEAPGAGFAASRLLPGERRALVRGDFTVLARRMLGAAAEVVGAGGGPVGVLGYSLGASVVAAMAAVSGAGGAGLSVRDVVLVEPVAVRRWGVAALVSAVRAEDRLVGRYVAETAAVAGAVRPWGERVGEVAPGRRWGDLLLLGNALRAARLAGDLGVAADRGLRRLVVVRGERSVLSPRADVDRLVSAVEGRGVGVGLLRVAGPHAFWQSLPAVASLAAALRRTSRMFP